MKSLFAFTKKELLEQLRSGKLAILGIIFLIIGIMNPAVAKMTPWMLEMLADSLQENGISVTEVTVSAMDSWVQFYKNIPIGLIAFILMQSSIFTKEYESGTLILSLTKGLLRSKVVISKATVLTSLWSIYYWLCFAVTYVYNAYFWDNSIAQNLAFSAVSMWIFGIFAIALLMLFSTIASSSSYVLLGCAGVIITSYLLGFIPKISKFIPTALTDGNSLIYGKIAANEYTAALIITAVLSLINLGVCIPIFNKKKL